MVEKIDIPPRLRKEGDYLIIDSNLNIIERYRLKASAMKEIYHLNLVNMEKLRIVSKQELEELKKCTKE